MLGLPFCIVLNSFTWMLESRGLNAKHELYVWLAGCRLRCRNYCEYLPANLIVICTFLLMLQVYIQSFIWHLFVWWWACQGMMGITFSAQKSSFSRVLLLRMLWKCQLWHLWQLSTAWWMMNWWSGILLTTRHMALKMLLKSVSLPIHSCGHPSTYMSQNMDLLRTPWRTLWKEGWQRDIPDVTHSLFLSVTPSIGVSWY